MSSAPAPVPVFKVAPGIQSYDWGKRGSASLAAQLAAESVPDFEVDEDKTYAELWMGTHPTLPSRVLGGLLADHLARHPAFIGDAVAAKFPDARHGHLPFLFKVLSIGTALSIQAHPDKPLARQLYDDHPHIYKDPNHKPEMAIALTPFLAFLNFLPLPTLLQHLLTVPELGPLIPSALVRALADAVSLPADASDPAVFANAPAGGEPSDAQKAALKDIFEALMTAPEDKVATAIATLVERYKAGDVKDNEKANKDLAVMLHEQYPHDVGVLCVFFLNVVELKRGEAAFLGANVPHAYIKGDIIECMATSDNVVRAGLTPKLRDVDTLVSMLTYAAGPASAQLLRPAYFDKTESTLLYDPPIDEFSVLGTQLARGSVTTHRPIDGPSIAVVTGGEAVVEWDGGELAGGGELIVVRGDVVFLAAGKEYKWEARKEFEAYRAFVEA
ncbi:Mannose-6-phosphate isomerase [Cryptotrichosporon argae]